MTGYLAHKTAYNPIPKSVASVRGPNGALGGETLTERQSLRKRFRTIK